MWQRRKHRNKFLFKFLLTHPVWDVTGEAKDFNDLVDISTHTSRVGCDYIMLIPATAILKFLLTHPVWDVTAQQAATQLDNLNFYSHIPCGMWREELCRRSKGNQFLLTHPVWDVTPCYKINFSCFKFLLTHPVWDVTQALRNYDCVVNNFYSHIPCGMWPPAGIYLHRNPEFLLTHPVWDVTLFLPTRRYHISISTHTSRVGCD